MVTQYGMTEKFGMIGLESVEGKYLDGRTVLNCGDATEAEIDQEVMRILKECYNKAEVFLQVTGMHLTAWQNSLLNMKQLLVKSL